MRKIKLFKRIIVCTLVVLFTIPFTAMSQQLDQEAAAQDPEKVFKPQELEQMLAPIALYPDALLAQALTAATYPLEIVEADRFVKENQGLKGEALLEAARDKDWEPTVKAMLEFPDILAMMDEQLEWTRKLGDAFLAQQSDCMDAVQRLRQKAYAQGNLATSEKQVIKVEPQTQIIIIEPASPEIVYVPVYDTAIIYGNWWYPAYPPYHFSPRRYSGIPFFSGFFVRISWGGWGIWVCNWDSRDVHINVDHYNHFTRDSDRGNRHNWIYKDGPNNQPWRYDPQHRQDAGYRDSSPSQRSGGQQGPGMTVNPGKQDIRKQEPVPSKPPTIDIRQKAIPAVHILTNSTNIQPGIKKQPAQASRENATPVINILKGSTNIQPGIKKQPANDSRGDVANPVKTTPSVRDDLRGNSRTQRSAEPSTSDLRVQKLPTPSTSMSNVKSDTGNPITARPTSNNSSRNKDDAFTSATAEKERNRPSTSYNLPPNRQIPVSVEGAGVLRQGPLNVVAR